MKVEYMCHSGDDLLVCNAARASFGKETGWLWTELGDRNATFKEGEVPDVWHDPTAWKKDLQDKDIKLIRFLAREKHLLPFRHPTLTLRCKAPLFIARQLGKHQTGMSWSEESRRYIKSPPEFYWPDKWRKAAENVKQGSSDEELLDVDVAVAKDKTRLGWKTRPQDLMLAAMRQSVWVYNSCLKAGMAPEQARMILPQNLMVTWVWTGTLLAWVHMLQQRLESHAQKEVRDFAALVEVHVKELYPHSYEALTA